MTCSPRRIARTSLVAVGLLGGLAVPLAPTPVRAGEGTAGLARLVLAARLADWGRADRNPLALIVAASIRNQVALKRVERLPEGGASTEPAPAGTETTVDGLLAEALAMAPKDAALAALAADVAAARTKGRVDGKGESVATVRAAGTDWYRKVRFEGTRYAEAYVELIGDGRLGVSVYDGQGNLVCRDPTPSVVTYCGWQPSATEQYDVKVENLGPRPVRYKIATN